MPKIEIFTTSYCSYCDQAKRLLQKIGKDYSETSLDGKDELRLKLSKENGGYRTVPMIFVNDKFIGGYTELRDLVNRSEI